MDPEYRFISVFENGDIPASYVSLPKGVSFWGMNVTRFCFSPNKFVHHVFKVGYNPVILTSTEFQQDMTSVSTICLVQGPWVLP